MTQTSISWRGAFANDEVNRLHAKAFDHRVFDDDWARLVRDHSLGWAVGRDGAELVGFVNVVWDGMTHAWLQDVMVDPDARHRGIGTALVAAARDAARDAGCEWLHVDFDDDLASFYFDACGFTPTNAGLIDLSGPPTTP